MIAHTVSELAALKAEPRVFYLFEFELGATTYRFTNSDLTESYLGNSYLPGFIDEVAEIEITGSPKINSIDIKLHDADNSISTLLLGSSWMNKPFKFLKVIQSATGSNILVKNAFEGLISDFAIDPDSSEVEITTSSIWADFEKVSSIKTNPKSQQRHYPNDTAFEHSASAMKKVYWGKDSPAASGGGGYQSNGSNNGTGSYGLPSER